MRKPRSVAARPLERFRVHAQPTAAGWLLIMPLGPSTNARLIRARYTGRFILAPAARAYLFQVGGWLRRWARASGFAAIADRARGDVSVWLILPRRSCDEHNYDKILCDVLERGGVTVNDRLLRVRHCGEPVYDTKGSCAIVEVRR